jgi:hypothetical protein
MPSLDSVRQKMYRSQIHFDELLKEVVAYYESSPGEIVRTQESPANAPLFRFQEKTPVPARIPLILGDCLQNLRSSLDYLVWELVEAAGKIPDDRLMFPIAITQKQYEEALKKRHRLDNVDSRAIAIIDRFQPFHSPRPEATVLAILDKLTNINKHRRVILTSLTGLVGNDAALPLDMPCMAGIVRSVDPDGNTVRDLPLSAILVLQEGLSKSIEVTNCVNTVANFIGNEMLPLFEDFFK